MSDDSFDDDDHLLMELVRATQKPQDDVPTTNGSSKSDLNDHTAHNQPQSDLEQRIFRADGEIAILRAQLRALQDQKSGELTRLQNELLSSKASSESQINALKQSVQRLEDEKKFLGNEVRALSASKRRKVEPSYEEMNKAKEVASKSPEVFVNEKIHPEALAAQSGYNIYIQDDWSQFCGHIWSSTILGSPRTNSDFLNKICLDSPIAISEHLMIPSKASIMSHLWTFILRLKNTRLDSLVFTFCDHLLRLCQELLQLSNSALAVPFLLSMVNTAITFKTTAVNEELIKLLTSKLAHLSSYFSRLLDWTFEAGDPLLESHTRTYQQEVLEKFTLLLIFDVMENATMLATQHGVKFVKSLWNSDMMDVSLIFKLLPENTERFKSAAQANILFNFVEMLSSSLTDEGIAIADYQVERKLVSSMIKVFLIDVEIKKDSMFYGLNRPIGNNCDFDMICQMIPTDPMPVIGQPFISVPFPAQGKSQCEEEVFEMKEAHEHHILSLRLRIAAFLETLIMSPSGTTMDTITSKESMKSMVRIIALEQNHIIHQPRSKHVHMRISIIGIFLKILYFIAGEIDNINTIIYPETLYELFVVLMRIAFGSGSLTKKAADLLSHMRTHGHVHTEVFNKHCEQRARQVAHFNVYDDGPKKLEEMAALESDFANGLEFPYEQETIEIAREILSLCVNHDEADNLYFNMNYEES
ncbi:lethal, checkpoint-defective, DNA damage sensitive protein [Candidozyma auris]|uniref:DNA damage checkpoint protein LCD1 n=2 Tax=Candidozyma auris TaxID=498019 RepID=A0A2H0ZET1_CANAR|nr:hypothetical_protein [[Candida] auris]KND99566.2 hypothetical protein QG37_03720 [[Candida] auris]PIS48558.1 hypothetical protein B9J08_005252 [[Candida] auris]PIS49169.1 hypothetical protein CJI97_005334 [[Candida] auris]QEO23148.1 hypothetical_protein [[Candida] auris]QWW24686.1 hypothetical protein CA7LBN_003543 [[Candida] auris]